MNPWLVVFLLMSLTLNILQFKAYQKLEEETHLARSIMKDFEKHYGSLETLLNKHRKTLGKKK